MSEISTRKGGIVSLELSPIAEHGARPLIRLSARRSGEFRETLIPSRRQLFLGRDAREVLIRAARDQPDSSGNALTLSEIRHERGSALITTRREFLEILRNTLEMVRLMPHLPIEAFVSGSGPTELSNPFATIDQLFLWISSEGRRVLFRPRGIPDPDWISGFKDYDSYFGYWDAHDAAVLSMPKIYYNSVPFISRIFSDEMLALREEIGVKVREATSAVRDSMHWVSYKGPFQYDLMVLQATNDLFMLAYLIKEKETGSPVSRELLRDVLTSYSVLSKGHLAVACADGIPYVYSPEISLDRNVGDY